MGEQTNTKRGRPSDYKPEYCQQLIDYMSANGDLVTKPFAYEGDVIDHPLGYLPNFFEGFATKIGVCRDTLDEWKKKHPEFSDAYKRAKDIQLDKMAKGTIAGVYNSAGAIFALKNMFGWRDKTENDVNMNFGEFEVELADDK